MRLVRVLFVCTGNTCRSPMAEAIARSVAGEAGIEFTSAGWDAAAGGPAAANAIAVVGDAGGGLASHRARRLTRELVETADVVVALDAGAREQARELGAGDKLRLLAERDIADPYGGAREEYRRTHDEIRAAVVPLVAELRP